MGCAGSLSVAWLFLPGVCLAVYEVPRCSRVARVAIRIIVGRGEGGG